MIIYQMIKKKEESNFLCNKDDIWWSLNLDKDAKVVTNIKDCKEFNQLYAIPYDIEKQLTMKELFCILYKELVIEEVKILCEENKWIAEMYQYYLSKKE